MNDFNNKKPHNYIISFFKYIKDYIDYYHKSIQWFFKRYRLKRIPILSDIIDFIKNIFCKLFKTDFFIKYRIKKSVLVLMIIAIAAVTKVTTGTVNLIADCMSPFTDRTVTLEVNSTFDGEQYVKKSYSSEVSEIDDASINTASLGTQLVNYVINNKSYTLKVKVEDTKSPVVSTTDVISQLNAEITPEMFIDNIVDDTKTTVKFKKNYSFNHEGTYNVVLCTTDEAGNTTNSEATLELNEDTEAPTIKEASGTTLKTYHYYIGQKYDLYKGLTLVDDQDLDPSIKVDDSAVNRKKTGTYKVTYTVTDAAGNSRQYTRTIKVSKAKGIVYLTFDDGPSENTNKILKILDQYNVKATFFVTGNNSKCRKYIVKAYKAGHTIGLHTYTHNYAKIYKSEKAYFKDLNKVRDMVYELTGFKSTYIRFPGGSSNGISRKYCKGIMTKLVKAVKKEGYQYYDWNVSSEDASGNNVKVSKIIKSSTGYTQSNLMILMHDTSAKSTTVKALPKIIEYYQNKGYVFSNIEDGGFVCHHGTLNN